MRIGKQQQLLAQCESSGKRFVNGRIKLCRTRWQLGATATPRQGHRPTNSRVFVPLLLDAAQLLDAAHMLSSPAQAAWRGHTLAGTNWSRWLGQLQVAPRVAVTTLIAALEAGLQAQPRAGPLNYEVHLRWQSEFRLVDPETTVTLDEIVRASQTHAGYIPGVVQEVLLTAFGGALLGQEVALLAVGMRAAQRGPAVPEARPETRVPHSRDTTAASGAGDWRIGVAAARESCDRPQIAPSHFNISDEAPQVAAIDGAGDDMEIDSAPAPPAPIAERPARRRRTIDRGAEVLASEEHTDLTQQLAEVDMEDRDESPL